jgi:hypothetical protein
MKTSEIFVKSIEPVFEYLIKNRYIETIKEAYEARQQAYESRQPFGGKEYISLNNITIEDTVWKNIDVSYARTFIETHFKFTREETDDFPEYIWDGWIYLEKNKYHKKLTNYDIYVDRYRNWCYWDLMN